MQCSAVQCSAVLCTAEYIGYLQEEHPRPEYLEQLRGVKQEHWTQNYVTRERWGLVWSVVKERNGLCCRLWSVVCGLWSGCGLVSGLAFVCGLEYVVCCILSVLS